MRTCDHRTFVNQTCRCLFLLVVIVLGQAQVGVKSNAKPGSGVISRSAVEKKIKAIVVEQLGVNQEEVIATARFVEDLGADPLDMVELIMTFEEAFEIQIPDQDAEKIRTVEDAVDYICKHVKARK